jgi:hypothetical protein
MDLEKQKTGPLDLKEKRGSFPRRSLKEMLQLGPGSSGKPRSSPAENSELAGGISAEGRDKAMARHLPEVKIKGSLMGVCLTDIPLQGDSTSSKHAVRERQGLLVPQTGELRLVKEALSGYARRKLRKARIRASEARTGGSQKPGHESGPNLGEISIENSKRPRSEGSNPTEVARKPKGPGTLGDKGPIRGL